MKKILHIVLVALLGLGLGLGLLTVTANYISQQFAQKEDLTDPDGFYLVDIGSKEFRTIFSLTEHNYRNLTGSETIANILEWKIYVISGPMAERMVKKYNVLGMTWPTIKTMVVFDSTHANWRLIMSHELTHILQTEDGRIMQLAPLTVEYEAELVSRWTFAVIEKMDLADDQRVWNRMSAKGKEQALKDLPLALIGEEQEK